MSTDTSVPRRVDGSIALGRAVRACVVTMPVASGLKLLGNLGTFNGIAYGVPQASEAQTASSVGYVIGEFVGSVLPVIVVPFWVFAVCVYLANFTGRRTLTAGAVLCLVGAGVTLPGLGVINFAFPALARAYFTGDTGAMNIVDSFFTWPRGAMLYPALLFPIGTVFLAVAMWRSQVLPKVAVALFVVSGFLIAIPIPLHAVRLTGGVLGLISGAWVAAVIWRDIRARDRLLIVPDEAGGTGSG